MQYQSPTRIFRLFVSSTFEDFKIERDVLNEEVFPKLRSFCRDQGVEFQVVDLRWGVTEDAGRDHRTLDICLNEIDRCMELAPRPNFLVLLGERYGWRPLPSRIDNDLFVRLLDSLEVQDRTAYELIRYWYRRDYNLVPSQVTLRPREGKFIDPIYWYPKEDSIRSALKLAVSNASATDQLRAQEFFFSATHHEIVHGALRDFSESGTSHVHAVLREFTDESSNCLWVDSDPSASSYLSKLRESFHAMNSENVHNLKTSFNAGSLDDCYLSAFKDSLYQSLKQSIKEQLSIAPPPNESTEPNEHQSARDIRLKLVGEDPTLCEYLCSNVQDSISNGGGVHLIEGPSGVGKSTLLAAAARKMTKEQSYITLIERYIGATPLSVQPLHLLRGIGQELRTLHGLAEPEQQASSLIEANNQLRVALSSATAERPIILVIDAIDQLSYKGDIDWLPTEKIPHVVIVASVLVNSSASLSFAKSDDFTRLQLEEMTAQAGKNMLEYLLSLRGRKLTDQQINALLEGFSGCPVPLYIRLASEIAANWYSWDQAPKLPDSIEKIIEYFFEWIGTRDHGKVLTSKVLGIFSAAKYGLSEQEILEFLSSDDEVMDEFRSMFPNSPQSNQLPPIIWSRLSLDLRPYLLHAAADGTVIYTFFHRVMGEVAKNYYLNDPNLSIKFHSMLADYFQQRPLRSPSNLPDLRKLSELPYQLIQSGRFKHFADMVNDFDFLMAKCEANKVTELLQELTEAMKESAEFSQEVSDIASFFALHHGALKRGNSTWPASKILLQLSSESGAENPMSIKAREWLESGKCNWHWLQRAHSEAPNGIEAILDAGQVVIAVFPVGGQHAISVGREGRCVLWFLLTGTEVSSFNVGGRITSCSRCPSSGTIVVKTNEAEVILNDSLQLEYERPSSLEEVYCDSGLRFDDRKFVSTFEEELCVGIEPNEKKVHISKLRQNVEQTKYFSVLYLEQSSVPAEKKGRSDNIDNMSLSRLKWPSLVVGTVDVTGNWSLGNDRWAVNLLDGTVQIWNRAATERALTYQQSKGLKPLDLRVQGVVALPNLAAVSYGARDDWSGKLLTWDLDDSTTLLDVERHKNTGMSSVNGVISVDGLLISWGAGERIVLSHPEVEEPVAQLNVEGVFEFFTVTAFWLNIDECSSVPVEQRNRKDGERLLVAALSSWGHTVLWDVIANNAYAICQALPTRDPTQNYARRYEEFGFDVLSDGRIARRWRDENPLVFDVVSIIEKGESNDPIELDFERGDFSSIRDWRQRQKDGKKPGFVQWSQNPSIQAAKVSLLSSGELAVTRGDGVVTIHMEIGPPFEFRARHIVELGKGKLFGYGSQLSNQFTRYSASPTKYGQVWDIGLRKCVFSLPEIYGTVCGGVALDHDRLLTWYSDRIYRVWQISSGVLIDECLSDDVWEKRPNWLEVCQNQLPELSKKMFGWEPWEFESVVGIKKINVPKEDRAFAIWNANSEVSVNSLLADGTVLGVVDKTQPVVLHLMKGTERINLPESHAQGSSQLYTTEVAMSMAEECLQRAELSFDIAAQHGKPFTAWAIDLETAVGWLGYSSSIEVFQQRVSLRLKLAEVMLWIGDYPKAREYDVVTLNMLGEKSLDQVAWLKTRLIARLAAIDIISIASGNPDQIVTADLLKKGNENTLYKLLSEALATAQSEGWFEVDMLSRAIKERDQLPLLNRVDA